MRTRSTEKRMRDEGCFSADIAVHFIFQNSATSRVRRFFGGSFVAVFLISPYKNDFFLPTTGCKVCPVSGTWV